jgi:flavorubredoxin
VQKIEKTLEETGIKVAAPGLSVKYVPDEREIGRCYEFGKEFAGKIKEA